MKDTTVAIALERGPLFDRVREVRIDGVPLPNTVEVSVVEGIDGPAQVTVKLLATRVEREVVKVSDVLWQEVETTEVTVTVETEVEVEVEDAT